MRLLVLALILSACGDAVRHSATPAAAASPAPADSTMTLFDFSDDSATWAVENDGVMGGRSKGFVEVVDGALVFTGEVVTRGGGFTSVRGERASDLSDYEGVELRVRGGGRTFELDVDDGTRHRGREVNRQSAFPTTEDWQTVRVAFADLETTAHGEPVRVDALDRSAVQTLGIYIADGIDGPFRLEVDWIRAY